MEFHGIYFDGKVSKGRPVRVCFDGKLLLVRGEDQEDEVRALLSHCVINPPLGRTRRSLRLPGGGRLETEDGAAVEALEGIASANRGPRIVHFLESRWKMVLCCLAGLAVSMWLFVSYGIPALAERVALSLPKSFMTRLTAEAVKTLDRNLVGPTRLPRQKGEKVRALFAEVARDGTGGYDYRVELRRGGQLGANALALPDGLIIVTDELASLARDDRELQGVLVHEIAHVEGRHAVRNILQSSGIAILMSVVMGDVASLTSMAASVPVILLERGYSREFEEEADRRAGLYLIARGWGTRPYRDMLVRLSETHPGGGYPSILSTHPDTARRVQRLKDLEERESRQGR